MTKLWNAARFVSTYLFDEEGKPIALTPGEPTGPDQWIVSRMNTVIREATDYLDKYEYSHALDLAERFFFAEFCDNYLEIIKERFWKPEKFKPEQVEAARYTLHKVLETVLKLFAPFIPYITEELYQIILRPMGGPSSIHISQWPKFDESLADEQAEESGKLLVTLMTYIRRWKTSQKVHANFPLKELVVTAGVESREKIEPLAEDLRAAARSETLTFGPGGELEIEGTDLSLKMTLGEKKPKE